jgi:valyl-tRNA synthetase
VPFRRVLLAGMVTDEHGQKMSKMKGNVIDPLDVVNGATLDQLLAKAERNGASKGGLDYLRKTYPEGFPAYGADALRYTLLSYSPQTTKIALSLKRVEGYRNFCNKLWNAARYALMHIEGSDARAGGAPPVVTQFANRWILSRLAHAIESTRSATDGYRLDEASGALYRFVWNELCDWYLELSKPLLANDNAACVRETRATLAHVLETALRALHPMMPFVTEEIWQRLPKLDGAPPTIMVARYPEADVDARRAPELEQEMTRLQAVIVAVRTIRAEHDLPQKRELPLTLRSADAAARAGLERERAAIAALCNAVVTIEAAHGDDAPPNTAVATAEGVTVLVPLAGLVDPAKVREKMERELKKHEKDLAAIERKLANAEFLARAPAALVEQERARAEELRQAIEQLSAAIAKLG